MRPENIFDLIRVEHQTLLRRFESAYDNACHNNRWEELHALCIIDFEANHHAKEEEYIFEAVKNLPALCSGGPMCTYYFDFHTTRPLLKLAQSEVLRITGQRIEPAWTKSMEEIRQRNLPLGIPGEDHEAGRLVLRGVLFLMELPAPPSIKARELFDLYLQIQKAHFDREESCFLRLCGSLLTPDEWTRILARMRGRYADIL